MAVSGHKVSDFQGSFSRGSAEDFEHCCAPCLIEGQHVEAHGYCIDCGEYLCDKCFRFHKKTKATRNHQLVDKDNMGKHSTLPRPTNVCTEKCSVHKDEVIKFFCPKHEELGCHDCMTMNHRTCKLDYIPDKCAGIGDSDEYREIVREIDQQLKEADGVLKKAASNDKDIDDCLDRVVKEIIKKRKEINDHLDTIQKKIEADANKKKARRKQKVKAVITSCTNFTANIKKLQSSLQNSKAADQNGQLFIDIKRAKSELKSVEIQQAEISLGKTGNQFTFNSNRDLENILAVQSFGELTEQKVAVDVPSTHPRTLAAAPHQTHGVTSRSKGTFKSLQHKTDIKLNKRCNITGCVVLSSGKLVLADSDYSTLIIVDPEKTVVVEETILVSTPWDITVLPRDQIAVTMPLKKQIHFMRTEGKPSKPSTERSIPVSGTCYNIIYDQNCLYVLCFKPYSIHILDMYGNIKNTISLAGKAVFTSPNNIVLSRDQNKLYVSDGVNHTIVSVTLQGEVSAKYWHMDLRGPVGMLVLDDGSLLVGCWDNHTIHHVSADWKQGRTVMKNLHYPRSLFFSADRSQVYIGGYNDNLRVFSVIYKM